MEGNRNTKISKLIFKARGRNLDIKTHKKWRYEDKICVGCNQNEESEEEFLSCKGFCDEKEILVDKISYCWLFGDSVDKMVIVAKELSNRLKVRKKILDEPG